jgi:hypothetical protein
MQCCIIKVFAFFHIVYHQTPAEGKSQSALHVSRGRARCVRCGACFALPAAAILDFCSASAVVKADAAKGVS